MIRINQTQLIIIITNDTNKRLVWVCQTNICIFVVGYGIYMLSNNLVLIGFAA